MKRTDSGLIATSFRTIRDVAVIRPRSLEDATSALARHEDPPAVLAGGTDMVARFNEGHAPSRVLALSGIDELRQIRADREMLRVGALVTHDTGSRHPLVLARVPAFARAWGRIANVRVRFTATIGGNIMARRVRYEMPILLSAIGARIVIAEERGERVWDADTYIRREPGPRELLSRVEIPTANLVAFDYERSLRPIMTQALAIRREGGRLHVRTVVGTEAMTPRLIDYSCDDDMPRLRNDAVHIARTIFDRFPSDAHDLMTSNAYLRGVGQTLLARQLARLDCGDR
jgi:aerobic carbon-monoxide dehydrogenase medium subunit